MPDRRQSRTALCEVRDDLASYPLFDSLGNEWANALCGTLDGMLREYRWSLAYGRGRDPRAPLPSYAEYVRVGRYSIGGPPHMWAALITTDDASTPAHMEHLRAMEQLASTCIRLANDLQSYAKEVAEGQINALVILSRALRDQGVSEEDALQQATQSRPGPDPRRAAKPGGTPRKRRHPDWPPRGRHRQHRPLRVRLLHTPRLPHLHGAGSLTPSTLARLHLPAGSCEREPDPLGDPATRPGISGVAYDTAWLAGMPAPTDRRSSRFPTALRWLVDNQLSDGSWGGSVRYEHDRVLCTLAALAPLAEFGRHAEERRAVEAGTRYLWQHGHLLNSEPVELVGFELLVPALVQRARAAGVAVPPHLDIYARQRAQKLDLIPHAAMYSPHATIAHSLEFLGDQADLAGLEAAQSQNGALGNSPAATAFYLTQTQSNNPQALDYLTSCMGRGGAGAAAPVLYPCDTFELLWAAYHLYVGGTPSRGILRATERRRLLADLAQTGVSLSRTFPIPDADDTAVALLLMHDLGEPVDPTVLQRFEAADGSFVSFPYERHSSVGVNAHVLHTLTRVPGYPDATRAIERILTYLIDQHTGLYWIDKWHISPLYATAHVLAALENLPPAQRSRVAELIERSREWLRQSQNADGSWGFYGQSTAEETAYGLLALAGNRDMDERDRARSAAAARFLKLKRRENVAHPPLWIDKCLYIPPLVVNAAIDGALTAWNKRVVRKEAHAAPDSLPPYQYAPLHAPAHAQAPNRRRSDAAVVSRNN